MNSSLAVPREMSESCLASLECEIRRHLNFTLAHGEDVTKPRYLYRALAIAVRDRLIEQWRSTERRLQSEADKKVYYLSLEFLIGRSLSNAVYNLDLDDAARSALHDYGVTLEEIAELELDAGLGNGGLGRLAACFLDSCANLQ
ncbi:MAG: glycogen/starch/alpha-glucan phosphorylase, partial [Planctomycetales bacterium]|nr:glycogen/starch/alpha-glucan phosphorylase [Planctomycetales bacterium]